MGLDVQRSRAGFVKGAPDRLDSVEKCWWLSVRDEMGGGMNSAESER